MCKVGWAMLDGRLGQVTINENVSFVGGGSRFCGLKCLGTFVL